MPAPIWRGLVQAHEERADLLTAGHRARKASGERHAIDDFLYDYYGTRPAQLRRWHPGAGTGLEPGAAGAAPHGQWRWYATDAGGVVRLDVTAYLADRSESVRFIHRLLTAIASRPAFTGCLGMHEWAMVYRQRERRHPLPLRLGQEGTDAVVESAQIRCTHFDAFRFFTPEAVGLNRLQPTRATQVDLDQPGCLHASMDCHKWASKLGPAVPGDLALDCFALARDIRLLDMQASPYDLSSYGQPAVAIETPEGRAEYVARQREFSQRAGELRARLIAVCATLLDLSTPGRSAVPPVVLESWAG
ncbi:3-methyladenine DNA glycosylase [Plantactinospora sp. S1510]|uniref:3-methyladenine DNA glycosylase n=1 Tax=Plantactinospora alkalitolerans TaxID=2789879 RepID=A0ABS0H703_9ACTN|nr:3-methyladenine DNA glycosylase [Plantactinospora alkalitolerans]MBF9134245.1 3-methyladenine DNA glycosylase [Plantactinospora alkalitolerans]